MITKSKCLWTPGLHVTVYALFPFCVGQPDAVTQCSQIRLCLHFSFGLQVFPPATDKGKHVFTSDFENKEGKRFVQAWLNPR